MSDPKTDQFAIVHLLGHQRIAGRISEQTFGGAALVRVDVPEVTYMKHSFDTNNKETVTIPAHTRSIGPASIYSIDWVDELTAHLAAQDIRHQPIQPYRLDELMKEIQNSKPQLLPMGSAIGLEDDELSY